MPRSQAPSKDVSTQTEQPLEVEYDLSALQAFEACLSDGHRVDLKQDPTELIDRCFQELGNGSPRNIVSLPLGRGGRAYAVRNGQARFLIAPKGFFTICRQGGEIRVSLKDPRVCRILYQDGTRKAVLVLDNSPQPAQVEGKFVVLPLVSVHEPTSVGAIKTREAVLRDVKGIVTEPRKTMRKASR